MGDVQSEDTLGQYYGDAFYEDLREASGKSAEKFVELLRPLLRPRSVVDVGCGRGTWLKAFGDAGAVDLVGYDGRWNSHENMLEPAIEFHGVDLNCPIDVAEPGGFNLALSLEVAEHLEPEFARDFVETLTRLSDVVVFSAAFPRQGGTSHVNEQPHSYWAELFASFGYLAYDFFRPRLWGDDDVCFWYQQNAFLYVRRGTPLTAKLSEAGHAPLENLLFMDCVHPELFRIRSEQRLGKAIRNTALARFFRRIFRAESPTR